MTRRRIFRDSERTRSRGTSWDSFASSERSRWCCRDCLSTAVGLWVSCQRARQSAIICIRMKLSVCLPILSDVSPCGAALMTLSTVIINTQSRVQSVRAGAGLQATGPSDLHRNPSVLLGDSTSRRPPSCVDHVIYTPTDLVTQTHVLFQQHSFMHMT